MKKFLLPVLLAFASVALQVPTAQAQSTCPTSSPVVSVTGNITGTETWTRGNIYLLNGSVNVVDGGILNIEDGTIIKGATAVPGSGMMVAPAGRLVIERGGKIFARGTAARPIVFTSNEPEGNRNRGNWGGVVILGKAPVAGGTPTIEGGVNRQYGGTDPADNSGVFRYVRIEFSGIALLPDSEINGLTMGGVGSGTEIDYVQVTNNGDDSFEWFGGTVNAKHLVSVGATDDDFDTDFGFSGKVQYGLIIRNPDEWDAAGASSAFESTTGSATPLTTATFSNVTALLPGPLPTGHKFNSGLLLRSNSSISVFNSVFAGWPVGLTLEGAGTQGSATNGGLVIKNTVLANASNFLALSGTYDVAAYFNDATRANQVLSGIAALNLNADNVNFVSNTAPNYTLPAASPLVSGGAFTDAKLADPFFDKTGVYRGAFGPAGTPNWAAGWTNFNPQITCYNRPGFTLASRTAANKALEALAVTPNPTADAAVLNFNVKTATTATVRVVDALGREVATLLTNGKLAAGPHALALPTSLNAGVYLALVTTAEATQSVRFVVAK